MRYLALDAELTLLGTDGVMVHSSTSASPLVIEPAEARVLGMCRVPKSLEAHRDAVLLKYPVASRSARGADTNGDAAQAAHVESIQQCLERLVDKGLLVPERAAFAPVHARAAESSREAATARIASVCIPTRGRPATLRRALESYLANDRRAGRSTEFVVIDDSLDARGRSETCAVLHALKRETGQHLRYANREQRESYASVLARRAGVPEALVRFALVGEWGGTRNSVLLDTVGTMILQVDDDTVGTVFRPPSHSPGVAFSSNGDVNDYWYYASLAEAVAASEVVDEDLLALHESVLGRSVAAIVADAAEEPSLGDMVSLTCLRDAAHPDAKVAVSYGGMVGHWGGLALPQYRLNVSGDSFDRLVASEEAFRATYRSPQTIRTASRLTLADVDFCITAHMALDNRSLVPPFMPIGSGEDTLFGVLRGVVGAPAFAAFIPFGVLHERENNSAALECSPPTVRVNDMLNYLTAVFLFVWPSRGDEMLLQALGDFFISLASQPADLFGSYMRRTVHGRISSMLRAYERLPQERTPAPEFWRAEVRAYAAQLRTLLLDPDPASPCDLPGTPEERQASFQTLLGRFGQLLQAWPAILSAAAELRAEGVRVSKPL